MYRVSNMGWQNLCANWEKRLQREEEEEGRSCWKWLQKQEKSIPKLQHSISFIPNYQHQLYSPFPVKKPKPQNNQTENQTENFPKKNDQKV